MNNVFVLAGIILIIFIGVQVIFNKFIGFSNQKPSEYSETSPLIDIQTALSGEIIAEGLIHDFRGRVATRFVAKMNGVWNGDTGVLTEEFKYDNGRVQQREWTIRMGENGNFTATAPDIIGTAVGKQSGSAIQITYTIKLPEEAGSHVLSVVDWIYLLENGSMINRSEMRKFGVKVAELTASMRKAD